MTELISLRRYVAADAQALIGWVPDRAAMLMWSGPTFEWPLDRAQLEAVAAQDNHRSWTALDPADEVVGHAAIRDDGDGAGRLSRILVSPEARGRGVASASQHTRS